MSEIIQAVKPLNRVVIKYSNKKEETIMFFEKDVHISYNMIAGTVCVCDEPGNCLFIAHWNLVDYCQVATDVDIKPIFVKGENLDIL